MVFAALSLIGGFCQEAQAKHRRRNQASVESIEKELAAETNSQAPLQIDHVDGSTLYFKTLDGSPVPKPLAITPLTEVQPLGALRGAPGGQPYFIVRAKPCKECKLEPGIYALQASGSKPVRFNEPGRIVDNRSRAVVMDSRAFFGRCLAKRKGDVLVIFQKEKVDRRRNSQQSVVVAEPVLDVIENGSSYDHLQEQLLDRRLPDIRTTLRLVRSKACHEIDGRNRVMASRPPEVNLKRQKPSEDDDAEDDTHENQTDRDFDGGATPASD